MKIHLLTAALAILLSELPTARAEIRFLAHGHTDLALDYTATNNTWNFHVGSDTLGAEFAPDEVVLKVKSAAQSTVPDDAKFGFLGRPGTPVWILPQAQNEALLYLGYGGDGIPDGVFVGNQVNVALKLVTGPGNFFSYRVDGFGNPQVLFNSADGISTNDVATVQSGGDAHLAWAFSQPGDYTVVLEASGILVTGNQLTSSGPVTFTFNVGAGPKILSTGHTDLAIDYSADADTWDVHVGSDALEETYDADDAILQVKGEANTAVPSDPRFSFLGNAGDPIWVLPQAQNETLLYLGYGGDGISDGVFAGNQVRVALKSVTGPGNFFSYAVDSFGSPKVLFNTVDGISTNDVGTVQSGGDAHLAWAFTQPGDYAVTVEVSASLAQGNKVVTSGPVTYTFSVLKPVVPLTVEHVDIRVLYDPTATNSLSLVARDENHQINYQTNEAVLVVAESAKLSLPAGTPFGNQGVPLWVLPQSQDPALLYLGLSAEGIAPGIFAGNLEFRLRAIKGPGDFFLWQAGQSGFDVQMNSADGISEADSHAQIIGSHEHFNWGFTTNGVYELTVQVSGQRVGESTNIESLLSTFTFNVLPLPTNAPPTQVELSRAKLLAGGGFSFDVLAAENSRVEIQVSEDLQQWNVITNLVIATPPPTVLIPADATKRLRFFRAKAN